MGKINYARLAAGAILAGIFYFIAAGFIHGAILGSGHMAAITAAGKPIQNDPTAYAYFAIFDLGKGLVFCSFMQPLVRASALVSRRRSGLDSSRGSPVMEGSETLHSVCRCLRQVTNCLAQTFRTETILIRVGNQPDVR